MTRGVTATARPVFPVRVCQCGCGQRYQPTGHYSRYATDECRRVVKTRQERERRRLPRRQPKRARLDGLQWRCPECRGLAEMREETPGSEGVLYWRTDDETGSRGCPWCGFTTYREEEAG